MQTVHLKSIRAVYETNHVSEEVSKYLNPLDRFTSPDQIFNAFRFLTQETKEYFLSILLDGKNRILCMDVVSIGSLNQSIVHPREVFKTAMLTSAAAMVLIHNHPSGSPEPSREDREITRRLKEAGELLGVSMLDHIIIGDTFFSFTAAGLL